MPIAGTPAGPPDSRFPPFFFLTEPPFICWDLHPSLTCLSMCFRESCLHFQPYWWMLVRLWQYWESQTFCALLLYVWGSNPGLVNEMWGEISGDGGVWEMFPPSKVEATRRSDTFLLMDFTASDMKLELSQPSGGRSQHTENKAKWITGIGWPDFWTSCI